jgi:hypothetical protein
VVSGSRDRRSALSVSALLGDADQAVRYSYRLSARARVTASGWMRRTAERISSAVNTGAVVGTLPRLAGDFGVVGCIDPAPIDLGKVELTARMWCGRHGSHPCWPDVG